MIGFHKLDGVCLMLIHITLSLLSFNNQCSHMHVNGSGKDWTANLLGSKILQTFTNTQSMTPVTLKWMVGNR
jgi:hypothetical protein